MIFTNIRLLVAGVGAAAIIGAFTWIYFQGKDEAREECLAEQAKAQKILQDKLNNAREQNKALAEHLATTISDIDNSNRVRVKEIIKYVENNPDSDTVVFDDDGLSILNAAQEGAVTNGK